MKTKLKKPVSYSWEVERKDNDCYSVDISKLTLYQPKGKTMEAVKEEVKDMRPANQAVMDYLIAHPDEAPEGFKDYWLYFFGSQVRGRGGSWDVPCTDWDGSEFYRYARWLRRGWSSGRRVVLMGDLDTGALPAAETDGLNIEKRVAKIEAVLRHYNLSV